jgi:hypothetical protein
MLAGTVFVEWQKSRSPRATSPIHEQATNAPSNPEPQQKSGAAPNSQGASDSNQNGSPPPAPAAGQAVSGPPQEKPATEERRPEKFSLDWWLDSPTTIFSGLLVAVVFLQFAWMVRQEKWLRVSALVQAAVERAYVSVDNLGAHGDNNIIDLVTFQMINSGRIPAQTKEVIFKFFIGASIERAPNYENPLRGTAAIIRPSAPITQPVRFTDPIVSTETLRKLETREWCVFVWGRITYTDPFGGPEHVTGFAVKGVRQINGNYLFEIEGGRAFNYMT